MNKGVRWADVLFVVGAEVLLGCQAQEDSTSEIQLRRTGRSLGMIVDVVDNATRGATVFNADTNTILGTVPAGAKPDAGGVSGDCSITRRGRKGFFTHFDSTITVVDLTTTPPTLAGGPNPIPIDNEGLDTALSPNGKFLLVCDGGGFEPISVIDVATQTQIGTFDTGPDSGCISVEVCSDGSVLITSSMNSNVRRLRLSESGVLTDTGETLFVPRFPTNAVCSPEAKTGIVMGLDGSVISFKIPGLTPVSTRNLGFRVFSGAINHAGNRAYFRSTNSIVSSFAFNQRKGIFSAVPLFQVPVATVSVPVGVDQLAVHPSDASIYVSEPGGVRILDARTGATIGSITSTSLSEATGVCFGAVSHHDDDPGDDDSPGDE